MRHAGARAIALRHFRFGRRLTETAYNWGVRRGGRRAGRDSALRCPRTPQRGVPTKERRFTNRRWFGRGGLEPPLLEAQSADQVLVATRSLLVSASRRNSLPENANPDGFASTQRVRYPTKRSRRGGLQTAFFSGRRSGDRRSLEEMEARGLSTLPPLAMTSLRTLLSRPASRTVGSISASISLKWRQGDSNP